MNTSLRLVARCLGSLVAAALLLGVGVPAFAQTPLDPVEKLRQTLNATYDNLPEREQRTKACLGELHSLSELRKAVVLREWRHRHPSADLANVDKVNRDALAVRFRETTRKVLTGGEAGSILAALEMLSETASSMRAIGEPPTLTRPLTAEVARLVGETDPAIRAAAARTLGKIDPDVNLALGALAALASAPDAALRQDAAAALGQVFQVVAQPWTGNQFNPTAQLHRQAAAETAGKMLPLVGTGAVDPNREVRRRSLTTLGLAATLLGRMPPAMRAEAPGSEEAVAVRRSLEAARVEVRPLAMALRVQVSGAVRSLSDRDPVMKVLALKVLEETSQARLRWLPQDREEDPLADGLVAALPAMAETLADDDVQVRRATCDVLETYGPLASAAAPAVTKALKDSDRFVRWSAVRTLGAIGPPARPAIPALTKLLQDPDLDVRVAAAGVLQVLDPKGQGTPKKPGQPGAIPRSTLPALIKSLNNDESEMRLAAIQALAAMGPNARPAVPALAQAVRDADPRVRLAAVRTIGALGTAAQSVADVLRQALKDEDDDVRRAAGDALLNLQQEK